MASIITSTIRVSRFALGFAALQACSSADPASDPGDSGSQAPFPETSSQELQATLDGVVANGVAPGVTLTVRHPSYRTWSGASGVLSIETGERIEPATRFRAGSMMKVPVATAVLQLVERGELDLGAGITELLPPDVAERIPDSRSITLRMLMNHTSGIPEFSTPEFDAGVAADPKRVLTFDELLGEALSHPPSFAPGAGWSYSNTNYLLLGAIIERVTGMPWRAAVRERVFSRAKLAHTELPEEGNARCDGCSRGYQPIGDDLVDLTEVDPSMAGPAGGSALITTPQDLAQFLSALVAGKMFDDPNTVELMLDFEDAANPDEAQTGYGLGLQRMQVGEVELVGHLGGTAGFQCFVLFHPPSGIVTSGYMNRQGDFGAFIIPALEAIARVE
jgi:D-alanyl-D-alanine carboxypeptidase